MNTHLEQARQLLLQRRKLRLPNGYTPTMSKKHPELRFAYQGAGGRYFLLLYCPECMRGYVEDLVYELPAGAVEAKDIKIIRSRQWDSNCTAVAP